MGTDRFPRRSFLAGTAACGVAVLLAPSARATPDAMRAAMRDMLGEVVPKRGRVTLDIPPLVENGNTVPLTVVVDSPMSETDYVKTSPYLQREEPRSRTSITAHLGPRNGKAQVATRIKLADSQTVIAVAEMSDGSFWSESADVIVTIAACVEGFC